MLRKFFQRFNQDESAATAVEYAVMLAVIIVACIAAILNTGSVQGELWGATSASVEGAMPEGPKL